MGQRLETTLALASVLALAVLVFLAKYRWQLL